MAARRTQLAAFLRARRAGLRPTDVGLPDGSSSGRRRTPGLLREEVAQLAGVSVTWYTWLEQAGTYRHRRKSSMRWPAPSCSARTSMATSGNWLA